MDLEVNSELERHFAAAFHRGYALIGSTNGEFGKTLKPDRQMQ
jgi:hypothetical protein